MTYAFAVLVVRSTCLRDLFRHVLLHPQKTEKAGLYRMRIKRFWDEPSRIRTEIGDFVIRSAHHWEQAFSRVPRFQDSEIHQTPY